MIDPTNKLSSKDIDPDLINDVSNFSTFARNIADDAGFTLPANGVINGPVESAAPEGSILDRLSQPSLERLETRLSQIASDSGVADAVGLDINQFEVALLVNAVEDIPPTFNVSDYLSSRTDVRDDLQNRGFEGTALNIKAIEHYIVFGRFEEAGLPVPQPADSLTITDLPSSIISDPGLNDSEVNDINFADRNNFFDIAGLSRNADIS